MSSVVRYDAGAWLTLDPATLLQTGAFIQGLGTSPGNVHLRYADNEHAKLFHDHYLPAMEYAS